MKIVVDENIEFGKEAFSTLGDVTLLHGRKITNEIVKEADALVTRSVTNVTEELLRGSNVKFVGTATIGKDHLDINYLNNSGIVYSSAPGCNSYAVTEYVFTAMAYIANEKGFSLENKSLGVVGYGNIGTKIAKYAKALGMYVLVNDPPVERETNQNIFSSLEETLKCDLITFHVPLNKTGIDKTLHLLDEGRINSLKPGTILINSSRGAVVDNTALLKRIKKYNDLTAALDVWENEPSVNLELLDLVDLGTPHIAGYSLEGKVNGTAMIYEALCNFIGKKPEWKPSLPPADNPIIELSKEHSTTSQLQGVSNHIYPIRRDSDLLKKFSNLPLREFAEEFDKQRKNYPFRREFNNYRIESQNLLDKQKDLLKAMRFEVE